MLVCGVYICSDFLSRRADSTRIWPLVCVRAGLPRNIVEPNYVSGLSEPTTVPRIRRRSITLATVQRTIQNQSDSPRGQRVQSLPSR